MPKGKDELYGALFFLYLLFFIIGYYVTAMPSSKHGSLVRIGILVLAILIYRGFSINDFICKARGEFYCLPSRVKVLLWFVLLFFIYFALKALFLFEFAELRRVMVIALFVAAVATFSFLVDFKLERLLNTVSLFGVAVSIVFIVNYFSFNGLLLGMEPLRIKGITGHEFLLSYGNTIIAGLFLCFLFIAVSWSFINSRSFCMGCVYFVGFLLLAYAVFHTAARTAWVAAAVAIAVLFFCSKGGQKSKAGLLVFFVFTPAIVYFLYKPEVLMRRGLTYRESIWAQHLNELNGFSDWLFGKGLSANMYFAQIPGDIAKHSHSIYVECLFVGGLIGIFLFIFMLVALVFNLVKVISQDSGMAFLLSVLAGGAVSMMFDYSGLLDKPNLIWLWLWLPLSLSLARLVSMRTRTGKLQ